MLVGGRWRMAAAAVDISGGGSGGGGGCVVVYAALDPDVPTFQAWRLFISRDAITRSNFVSRIFIQKHRLHSRARSCLNPSVRVAFSTH